MDATDSESLAGKFRPATASPPHVVAGFAEPEKLIGSSMSLEEDVAAALISAKAERGLTAGEFVIAAIEATVVVTAATATGQLGEIEMSAALRHALFPHGSVGGGVFSARPVGGERAKGRQPVNIRLYPSDFDRLDTLVDRFAARSRAQLITAAIRAYTAATPDAE